MHTMHNISTCILTHTPTHALLQGPGQEQGLQQPPPLRRMTVTSLFSKPNDAINSEEGHQVLPSLQVCSHSNTVSHRQDCFSTDLHY